MEKIKKNPYNPRGISSNFLFNPDIFYGREYIVRRIYSSIINQQSISLIGRRYIGKSSLLQYLCLPHVPSKFGYDLKHYILVLISLKEHLYSTPDDFFYHICKYIFSKCLHQFSLNIDLQPRYGADAFINILEQIKEQGYHTILLFDDFEKLTRNSILDLEFFSFLRSQATSGKVSYVTTTTAPLYNVSHRMIEESPFFNIFGSIEIGPLEQNIALRLIIEPSSAVGYPFSPLEIEGILKFAGRHPFFIQYICSFLIDEKYQQKILFLDTVTFETRFYNELAQYFAIIYLNLEKTQKDQLLKEIWPAEFEQRIFPELSESFLFCNFLYKEYQQEIEPVLAEIHNWHDIHAKIRETLATNGSISASHIPLAPVKYVDKLFKRYINNHPKSDLEHKETSHSLHFKHYQIAQRVKKIEDLLIPFIQNYDVDRKADFIQSCEKLLSSFFSFIEMNLVSKSDLEIFIGLIFNDPLNVTSLLILITLEKKITNDMLDNLCLLLREKTATAVLLLFCDTKELRQAKKNAVNYSHIYAFNIAIINQDDLREIVSTRDPEKSLRHIILSQMNLTLVNPYVINGPTPLNLFFGREHELREITRRASSVSYILTGGRRIGKTSIMHYLYHERLPAAGFHTIYQDCSMISSYEDFLHTKAKTNNGQNITFSKLFESLDKYEPLVLLMDEIDKIVPNDRRSNWPFFKHLRNLINSGKLQVILCGERTLHEALNAGSGPLHNFGPELSIGMLEKAAVAELVTKPMKQLEIKLVKENEIVDFIWQISSGHPNVVQRICDRLIRFLHFSKKHNRRILLDDVAMLVQDVDFQRNDFLHAYWENATLLERIISLLMITPNLSNWTLRDVRHSLEKYPGLIGPNGQGPNAMEVSNALDRLINLRGVLRHSSNGYSFAVASFPRIVTNSRMIEDFFEIYVDTYHRYGDLTLEEIQLKESR